MTCRVCGAAVTLDPRSRREVCSTCSRGPAFCSCKPVAVKPEPFIPEWRRRDLAKVMDHGMAA